MNINKKKIFKTSITKKQTFLQNELCHNFSIEFPRWRQIKLDLQLKFFLKLKDQS